MQKAKTKSEEIGRQLCAQGTKITGEKLKNAKRS